METNTRMTCLALRCVKTMPAVFVLSALIGCDPCLNNPCDDGVACNGVETCTANGGTVVCDNGTPIECAAGEVCLEPVGVCENSCSTCASDADCANGFSCTTSTCETTSGATVDGLRCTMDTTATTNNPCPGVDVVDCSTNPDCPCDDGDQCTDIDDCTSGTCEGIPIECPTGQSCDPATGQCVSTGPATMLVVAAGTYTGASGCGDDDDQVTLVNTAGTLSLTGFTGNPDLILTLLNDLKASANNVVAFTNPGHTLTITLDPTTGQITFELTVAGQCSTTLTKVSC